MKLHGTKIRVDSIAESHKLQQHAFTAGFEWPKHEKQYYPYNIKGIEFKHTGHMLPIKTEEGFESCKSKEINIKEVLI